MRATTAHIDLAALRQNLKRVRAAAPASRVIAIVKANAYGHGAARVLPALASADALGVACAEEAMVLREAGATQPILLLEGCFDTADLELASRHALQVVVHDVSQLEMLERSRLAHPISIWLKIDTAMHRLGFEPRVAVDAWRRLKACAAVAPKVRLMSHLASADDHSDSTTHKQLALWREATRDLSGERSFANSAGILGWRETHLEWVRPGVMLYGVSPFHDRVGSDEGLRPVMHLASRLIAVKQLKRGDRVGYSGMWECPADMPVGIAAVGYGDGYPRHAPSGTPVLVNGSRGALAGRVSMDMIAIDLRNAADARVGDPVTLWGPGLPVETIAHCAGTIAYELLCGVTARVRFEVKDIYPETMDQHVFRLNFQAVRVERSRAVQLRRD